MPKFHHQWKPDEILVERDMSQPTVDALQKMGYKIRKTGAIGRTELILINGKKIEAVADKRGADAAAGY
jgi:gamma-glutamyltranspeptidase/glutathione hydrolase